MKFLFFCLFYFRSECEVEFSLEKDFLRLHSTIRHSPKIINLKTINVCITIKKFTSIIKSHSEFKSTLPWTYRFSLKKNQGRKMRKCIPCPRSSYFLNESIWHDWINYTWSIKFKQRIMLSHINKIYYNIYNNIFNIFLYFNTIIKLEYTHRKLGALSNG